MSNLTLTVSADFTKHCLQCAEVLESSRKYLDEEIEVARNQYDHRSERVCMATCDATELTVTRDNLAGAVEFLKALAAVLKPV